MHGNAFTWHDNWSYERGGICSLTGQHGNMRVDLGLVIAPGKQLVLESRHDQISSANLCVIAYNDYIPYVRDRV